MRYESKLRNMVYFYSLYPELKIYPQLGEEIQAPIYPQVGADLFQIPWGHIKVLIDKCKDDPKKLLFYTSTDAHLRTTVNL